MTLPRGKGQLTLVALFGEKEDEFPELCHLIEDLQSGIATVLGEASFDPYSEQRVHGTIIGLEGERMGGAVVNRDVSQALGQPRAIELRSAVDFLLDPNDVLPVFVQIGGFGKNTRYPFTSQGRHPYLRSFSIQGSIAVAMGWPREDGLYTSGIDRLRRAFNRFNIYHKYHDSDDAFDDDFFFVLGNVVNGLEANALAQCETQMRILISQRDIGPITIGKDQLKIVAYDEGDTTFEHATAFTLEDAKKRIGELECFYVEGGRD